MLSSGALSAAKIRLGDNYPNPVVVAPEWSRHQKGGKVNVHFLPFILFAPGNKKMCLSI
jgi:hypothetical protein